MAASMRDGFRTKSLDKRLVEVANENAPATATAQVKMITIDN
jgi:hypothetical protein